MTDANSSTADRTDTRATAVPRAARWLSVPASGLLVGLGVLALARGVHLYVTFYSYASGIGTSRLTQTLFWAAAGGVLLSIGVFLLAKSLETTLNP